MIRFNENFLKKKIFFFYELKQTVPTNPLVDKSAETALDKANEKSHFQGSQRAPPHQGNQSERGKSKSRISINDLFSPRVRDAVLTTVMGLAAVGFGGVIYQYG